MTRESYNSELPTNLGSTCNYRVVGLRGFSYTFNDLVATRDVYIIDSGDIPLTLLDEDCEIWIPTSIIRLRLLFGHIGILLG